MKGAYVATKMTKANEKTLTARTRVQKLFMSVSKRVHEVSLVHFPKNAISTEGCSDPSENSLTT